MNDFELTILTYQDTKEDFFKNLPKLEEQNELTDLALIRDASSYSGFWTSSPFEGRTTHIITYIKDRVYSFSRSNNRDIGILPVLVPSSILWNRLLNNKKEFPGGYYQVSFLEYPQEIAGKQEQVFLKEKLASNSLLPTGKVYVFDSVASREGSEYVPFKGKTYPEYIYKDQKYIYVDINRPYSTFLSNGYVTTMGENIFIKVEPVSWWMDRDKERLISSKVLLGGIQFQCGEGTYDYNFRHTFLQYYLDTYMKKELIPSVIKEKSAVFDSDETLKRLVYKKYGKKG